MESSRGTLYLIPTPLGDNHPDGVLPSGNREIILQLDVFIVEELRTARRFLRSYGYTNDFEGVTFYLLNEHTAIEEWTGYLDMAVRGKSIGLLSEAGVPAVADPGALIVRLAHEKNIRVVPLVGPSSILMALMASGLNGQEFTFHGYLPVKPNDRKQSLKEINKLLHRKSHTHIFIEAPYRNRQIIESVLEVCNDDALFCIATNISLPDESIITKTVREWKKIKPDPGKNPTVFLLL